MASIISLKYGLLVGICLVLLFQLLIITMLFRASFPSTKQLVAVEISPGALGLLKRRDIDNLIQNKYSDSNNKTELPSIALLTNQTLNRINKDTPNVHREPEAQDSEHRRIDIREANAQKRSMEDYHGEKAPRAVEVTVPTGVIEKHPKPTEKYSEPIEKYPKPTEKRAEPIVSTKLVDKPPVSDTRAVPRDKRIQKPSMLLSYPERERMHKNGNARSKMNDLSNKSSNPFQDYYKGLEKLMRPELLEPKYLQKEAKNLETFAGVAPPVFDDKKKTDEMENAYKEEKQKMLEYWKKVLKTQERKTFRNYVPPQAESIREKLEKKRKKERNRIKFLSKGVGISEGMDYLEEVCKVATEPLVECKNRTARELTPREKEGMNIMYTLRTTLAFHTIRLPLLLETWLGTVDSRTVFVVSDGVDNALDETLENIGMHYINAQSGTTHNRTDLCCKAGVELEMIFQPDNEGFDWLCHVDDDMYIHEEPLIKILAKFDPKTEPIYLGRSGSDWGEPRLVRNVSMIGKQGQKYHFAVGGMYCLSRAMLELAKPYLVGCEAFNKSCYLTQEPEDVTVGIIIGVLLKQKLTRTEMIYTHGLDLVSTAPSPFLSKQIAFSHGYGSLQPWNFFPNVVYVPGGLFNIDEDISQFRSIHCHIYPTLEWCKEQMRLVAEAKKENEGKPKSRKDCYCDWQNLMCCEVYREGYGKLMSDRFAEMEKKKHGILKKNKTDLNKEKEEPL